MSHTILGLGMAALTVAGSVWYLPAVLELRAGDDRPVSTRIAASATVAGWATAAVLAVLLFLTSSWQAFGALAVLGGLVVVSLGGWARVRRRQEEQEEMRRWEALHHNGHVENRRRAPRSFATWSLTGLVVAWAVASAVLLTGFVTGRTGLVVAFSAATAVFVGFLTVAFVRSEVIRRRSLEVAPRIPRQQSRGSGGTQPSAVPGARPRRTPHR